jgi:hypothetical protein
MESGLDDPRGVDPSGSRRSKGVRPSLVVFAISDYRANEGIDVGYLPNGYLALLNTANTS